jgi:hypothetical protein
MFSFLFKKPKPGTGAEIDTRTPEEKEGDYKLGEIVASVNPVNWQEKNQSQWRKFPIFNQNGSGSCVAQTMAKLLGIMYWIKNKIYVHFSATHVYQQRYNKPGFGMQAVDAFNIAKNGVTLEDLVPSQAMTDAQMDVVDIPQYKKDVGAIFKITNYISDPIKDIDTIASIIQTTGKGVMVWFYFKYDEWNDKPVAKYLSLDLAAQDTCRHSVTAVDYALVNGEKCLIIEDSWGPQYGLGGQRIITESFFKTRNWFAGHPMNFKFDEQGVSKPHYTFTKQLQQQVVYSPDPDVKALQEILRYEGFFPANIEYTGNYGPITAKAVLLFQQKYNIGTPTEITSLKGKIVGPKTLAKLNELYN